ncbi:hypothetical protein F2Q68_00029524 [Brassica cretica]|uniref:Uncharacterized protein n=3 Tax=Brassica TaxID=3705 RepID=A0A8S9GGY1_BRACR|nr:hypothetical protein F2Q68_00029524 [Brassica cretica]
MHGVDFDRLTNRMKIAVHFRIPRFVEQKKKRKEKNIDILLADDATYAQEWLVESDDGEHESAMGVGAGDTEGAADDDDMADNKELHDEDFISDAKEEDFAGTNLESDEDQIPNMYGEEEYVD